MFRDSSGPHSAMEPAVVGQKIVWVRPNCSTFLSEMAKFAIVSVWSSMKSSTVELICNYLFRDIVPPYCIFGQDTCQTPKRKNRSGQVASFKEPGSDKDLFLKNLDSWFNQSSWSFAAENTVIVDDSPVKHILNKSENVILPESWSYRGSGPWDKFLLDILLPWFQRLHGARD